MPGIPFCNTSVTCEASEGKTLLVEAVRTMEGFEKLGPEWQQLFERSKCTNVFLSFDWMVEWWKCWGNRRTLFILVIREASGGLVGVAPFSTKLSGIGRIGPVSVRFIGDEFVGSDHLDLLATTLFESSVPEAVARFLLQSKDQWDYIYLTDCRDSPLMSELRKQLRSEETTEHHYPGSMCPYVSLPESFDIYLAGSTAKLRKTFRRGYRSLQKEGRFDFLVVTESDELEKRFQDLVELHRLRFAGHKIESSFLLPAVIGFHKAILKKLATRKWARLYVLELAGRPVSMLYGFSIGKTFSFYQCGRDPRWSRFGVGHVLNGLCIEDSIKSGYQEFDFLRGGENYKGRWARHQRVTLSIIFFDRRFKSQVTRLLFSFIMRFRSLTGGLRNRRSSDRPALVTE
jgi:CelD/BcsL family acetyltransferase involved in cellulose biosynthesis